jgi:hypothetical protein
MRVKITMAAAAAQEPQRLPQLGQLVPQLLLLLRQLPLLEQWAKFLAETFISQAAAEPTTATPEDWAAAVRVQTMPQATQAEQEPQAQQTQAEAGLEDFIQGQQAVPA